MTRSAQKTVAACWLVVGLVALKASAEAGPGAAPAPGAADAKAGAATAPTAARPIALRLPPDLTYERSVGAEGAVVFRHTTHVAFTSSRCVACHPQTFSILRPTRTTSHEAMDAGRACGACHDGKKAFSTAEPESCASCHAGWGGEP